VISSWWTLDVPLRTSEQIALERDLI